MAPGTWQAHLMSTPPINGGLLLPLVVKTSAMSCSPSAAHGGVLLQDPLYEVPLSSKPSMSLLKKKKKDFNTSLALRLSSRMCHSNFVTVKGKRNNEVQTLKRENLRPHEVQGKKRHKPTLFFKTILLIAFLQKKTS